MTSLGSPLTLLLVLPGALVALGLLTLAVLLLVEQLRSEYERAKRQRGGR